MDVTKPITAQEIDALRDDWNSCSAFRMATVGYKMSAMLLALRDRIACQKCGGSGQFDEIADDIKCPACNETGQAAEERK